MISGVFKFDIKPISGIQSDNSIQRVDAMNMVDSYSIDDKMPELVSTMSTRTRT